MPYGIMDKSTADILREAGFDPDAILAPEDAESGIDVAIIFDGALDESFILDVDADWDGAARAIADRLRADFPDNEVVVATGHVYIGEDFIEGSGYDNHTY